MKTKLGVVGSGSMVGSRFCDLTNSKVNLVKADLHGDISVDITQKEQVFNFFKNYQFDWAILFSAFTDVDAAEIQRHDQKGACWQINVEGTKNIVAACQKFQRKLIFISTDFVFDGTAGPYSEEDLPGGNLEKVSWYGLTKLQAEKVIATTLSHYIILRISYPYRGPYAAKDDLPKRILRLTSQNQLYPMFTDQTLTPTFIDDLTPAVLLLTTKNQKGIFHLASPQLTNQFEFAKVLISAFDGDPKSIKAGSIVEFLKKPTTTPRPVRGGLKVEKIKKLGFTPTSWREGIEVIYRQSQGKLI